jgi:hypothetical protein
MPTWGVRERSSSVTTMPGRWSVHPNQTVGAGRLTATAGAPEGGSEKPIRHRMAPLSVREIQC